MRTIYLIRHGEPEFLADRMLIGTERVSMEERFKNSEGKCTTQEARRTHAEQFRQAGAVRDEINRRCGKERPL